MNRGEVKTRTHPPSQSVLLSCLISSHSKHFSVNNSRLQAKYHQYDGSSCLCRPLVWTLLDCMVDGWLVAGMFYVPTEREVLKCVKLNKYSINSEVNVRSCEPGQTNISLFIFWAARRGAEQASQSSHSRIVYELYCWSRLLMRLEKWLARPPTTTNILSSHTGVMLSFSTLFILTSPSLEDFRNN